MTVLPAAFAVTGGLFAAIILNRKWNAGVALVGGLLAAAFLWILASLIFLGWFFMGGEGMGPV
jgi:hypothetical protein